MALLSENGELRGQVNINQYLAYFVYAMVTNHLRAPYGVYFTKNRTILQRPYGARPAAGRIVRFLLSFFRHRTVPGEV